MDRRALARRLEGLSEVFASETPIATDLKAMAFSIDNMDDSKFSTILAADLSADKSEKEDTDNKGADDSKDASFDIMTGFVDHADDKKKAKKEAGLYWNREASELIAANLVKDITGKDIKAALPESQTPDGKIDEEKPDTLTKEQTPEIKDYLDSDMYAKSEHVKDTKKEAADSKEDAKKDSSREAGSSVSDVVKPKGPDASGDIDPEQQVVTNVEKGSLENMAKKESKQASYISEGVELTAPMIDASLSSKEASDLQKLFA